MSFHEIMMVQFVSFLLFLFISMVPSYLFTFTMLASPFIQSLEALQDGEHEKQRRHFIYFLLHQVTVSSNFSILMRKKAC